MANCCRAKSKVINAEVDGCHRRRCGIPKLEKGEKLEVLTQGATAFKDDAISQIFMASINDLDIADKVRKIKAQCEVERREAESQRLAGTETSNMLKQIMGLHQFGEGQQHGQTLRKISMAIDAGAAETVIPHKLVTDYLILETDKSRSGACYASATGEPIPNSWRAKVAVCNRRGVYTRYDLSGEAVGKTTGVGQAHMPSWTLRDLRRGRFLHNQ